MSISRPADGHLLVTGLEPLDRVQLDAGERELRLWPIGWNRNHLLRATHSPEAGTVVEWWLFAERSRVTTREGVSYSEPVDVAGAACLVLRRSEAGTACLTARLDGGPARTVVARLDSLRISMGEPPAPGRVQVDGSSLQIEVRNGDQYISYRLPHSFLRSDSAAGAMDRLGRGLPR